MEMVKFIYKLVTDHDHILYCVVYLKHLSLNMGTDLLLEK